MVKTTMINWLNSNPGAATIIGSVISALIGSFLVAWLSGKRAGKKAAQKEIESLLRIELNNNGFIAGDGAQFTTGPNSPIVSNVKGDARVGNG